MKDPAGTIRDLRARADGTAFPAEAEICLNKANLLMEKYGLTEADVNPAPPPPSPPIPHSWVVYINGQPVGYTIYGRIVYNTTVQTAPNIRFTGLW